MRRAFKMNRVKIAEINTQIEDNLSGIRVVKSFANEEIENEKAHFSIVMIDLNSLKHINDTYGHMKGDAESYQEYSYHGSYGGVPSK